MRSLPLYLFFLLFPFLFACNSCKQTPKVDDNNPPEQPDLQVKAPIFNEDSAYAYIKKQVDFGPRVNNTAAHVKCGDWFIDFLSQRADTVFVQKVDLTGFDGKILQSRNIIASFNPDAKQRIILSSHWDTRPFADQDTSRKKEAIDGANDGASGVGILLEIANVLKKNKIGLGIDIILFDAEDYGAPSGVETSLENSYCLGSIYWSKNKHLPNYNADFGILLDMVGASNATFTKEGTSMMYASAYVNYVWSIAQQLGYSNYFTYELTGSLTDDHKFVNEIANIPMIDIIHRTNETPSGFGSYWHTHDDNIKAVNKNTLKAVGQTVLQAIYQYDKKKSV